MNAAELNTELSKLVQRAMQSGVASGKLSVAELVGVLESCKLDAVRLVQDANIVAMAQQRAQQAANVIMLDRNGKQP